MPRPWTSRHEDQQNGAGQRRRLHQHRHDPRPGELAVDQQSDDDGVGASDCVTGQGRPRPMPGCLRGMVTKRAFLLGTYRQRRLEA